MEFIGVSSGLPVKFPIETPIAQELGEMNGFSQHPQQQDDSKTSGYTVHMHVVYLYIYMCVFVCYIKRQNK